MDRLSEFWRRLVMLRGLYFFPNQTKTLVCSKTKEIVPVKPFENVTLAMNVEPFEM